MTKLQLVSTKELFWFVDRAYPGASNYELAQMIDRDEKVIRNYRRQRTVKLETADHMLTKLDLAYLLSSGEIESYGTFSKREPTKFETLQQENISLKREIKNLKARIKFLEKEY